MWEKPTGDLGKDLMSADSIDTYLRKNEGYFFEQSITETLAELYERKSISQSGPGPAVRHERGVSPPGVLRTAQPTQGPAVVSVHRLEATLEETQRLLKLSAYAQLYPRSRRDAIIAYGILHHMELHAINDKLFSENEKTLS